MGVGTPFFFLKWAKVEKEFLIPGRIETEKRHYTRFLAETSFAFCWEKMRFLEQIYLEQEKPLTLTRMAGKWSVIRKVAWSVAEERCEKEVQLGARMSLRRKLSIEPSDRIDSFLMYEHEFHRKDYERYLISLRNHVHMLLFKMEHQHQKTQEEIKLPDNLHLSFPGTQKGAFVIELAQKYWKIHPEAKYDEVYDNYIVRCPHGKHLARTTWERIIRAAKIDPRPKEAKNKRGPGKKRLKK